MAQLGGVQPDAGQAVQIGLGRLQRGKGVLLRQMAQEAHDQPRGQAQARPGIVQRGQDAVGDHGEGDGARGVALGVEEHLHMPGPVGVHAVQIGLGHVEEVLLGAQNVHALIVDVQKVLQVGEVVSRTHFLDRCERDIDPVAPGKRDHLLRLQAAFQVKMQFRLRQARHERCCIRHFHPLVDARHIPRTSPACQPAASRPGGPVPMADEPRATRATSSLACATGASGSRMRRVSNATVVSPRRDMC